MRHFSVSPHLPAAARRVLCGTLTAAVLLSGMAFAPISAQATGTPTEHYKFQASSSYVTDHEKLHSNLVWGKFSADDASTGTPQAQQSNAMGSYTGTLYAPDGAVSITSFGLSANVSTKSGGAVNNPLYHYGLPTRVYQTTTSAGYEKAIDENLTLTLADMNALDTTGLAAVNIAMIYAQNPTGSGTNVALDKQLQVFVSLDGETYLPDSVGIRSSSLIGGGVIASGSQGLFYHIETENLLDIEGVNAGDTIQSIKILPDGEYERTYGKFYISELCVNTYPTLADFDAASPKENILTTPVDEDTLRQIAVEEALRTAQTVWQTEQNFTASYSSTSRTYKAGYTFHGPVYERSTDAARELFWSLIADDQYYTPDEMLQSHTLSSGTTNKFPYGMDCQTFVFNAISRVSRTNAWAVENTMGASRVSLLGDLEVVPHAAYTERDIIELNDEQALYENYAAAKAGDIAIHNMLDGSVHTRLIQSVTVKRNADGTINPSTSYMLCTEQSGSIRYYYLNTRNNTIGYVTNPSNLTSYQKLLYGSSSRVDEKYTFTSLRNGDYVAYTLDEYQRELVENVKVEVAPGSKTADKRFTEGGLNLAISSNYRIISYQVSLENRKSGETLFESDLIYPINPNPWGVNYKDTELDAILAALPEGAYRINTVVDSGPFTSLDEDTVPQTVKPLDFLVSDEIQCPTDGHSPSLDWTPVTAAWIRRNCTLQNNCYILPAGNYYLAEDVTVPNNYSLEIPQKTTLCLNGHALTISGTKTNHSIYLSNGSTSRLSVFDCSGGGTIQAGDAAAQIGGTDGQGTYVFYLTPGSQLNMYAGTITNSYVRNGAVCLDGNETDTSMGAVMNMYGGSITGNTSPNDCGGIYAQYSSQFNLYDGTISNNTGAAKSSGVTAADGAAIHLLGGTISGNSGGSAGGVYLGKNTSLIMEGGTISGNSGTDASAIYLYGSDTSFTMNSGIITNHTDGSAPIHVGADSASVTLYDGAQIINNKGTIAGAALLSAAGTFTMEGGTISGNSVEDPNTSNAESLPAGAVSLCSGATFTMKGGEISNNASPVNAGAVSNKGTMTLSGGMIYSNTVTGAGAGGVYNAGTLTMTGGAISKNTDSADASGGGVYNEGSFTMSGGSIAENTTAAADTDGGAGVYNAATGTFEMTGGSISKNLSGAAGGGVYNANTFTMSNDAKITENTPQRPMAAALPTPATAPTMSTRPRPSTPVPSSAKTPPPPMAAVFPTPESCMYTARSAGTPAVPAAVSARATRRTSMTAR